MLSIEPVKNSPSRFLDMNCDMNVIIFVRHCRESSTVESRVLAAGKANAYASARALLLNYLFLFNNFSLFVKTFISFSDWSHN